MTTAAAEMKAKVWTTEDLLAIPDDGVERWIIRGQLRDHAMREGASAIDTDEP